MKKNRMGLYLIYSSVTALVIFIASMISMTVYDIKKIPDLIDDISKIEVLINHICISNCPVAPLHYHFEHSKHSKEILQKKSSIVNGG